MQEDRVQEGVIKGKKAGRAEIQVKNHKLISLCKARFCFILQDHKKKEICYSLKQLNPCVPLTRDCDAAERGCPAQQCLSAVHLHQERFAFPRFLQELRGGDAGARHLSTRLSQPSLVPPSLRSTYWQRLWVMLPQTGSGSSGRAKSRLCSLLRTSSAARTAFRAPQWDIVPPGLRATVSMGWGRGHYFCTVGASNLEQTALESAQLSFHYYQNKKCIMRQKDFMLLMLWRGFFPPLSDIFTKQKRLRKPLKEC